MSIRVERVTIEGVNTKVLPKFAKFNSGGILVDGKWLNVAKKADIREFQKGETVNVEILTNERGYDSIVGIVKQTGKAVEREEEATTPVVPPVPSLPKTSVAPKADPNGVSPVAPAKKRVNENGSDGMTKQDWADKDARISVDAIHKSTLESPTLANLIIGKNQVEAFQTVRDFLKFNLDLNQQAKNGGL